MNIVKFVYNISDAAKVIRVAKHQRLDHRKSRIKHKGSLEYYHHRIFEKFANYKPQEPYLSRERESAHLQCLYSLYLYRFSFTSIQQH